MLGCVGPRFLNTICKELLSHERLIKQTVKADPLKLIFGIDKYVKVQKVKIKTEIRRKRSYVKNKSII